MPNLTYTLSPFLPFTKIASADANQFFTDIKTLLNTTKLDSTNVQQYGLTRDRIGTGTASHVIINDGSGYLSSEATLARSRGGLQFAPALTNNAGKAVVVSDDETTLQLGSPSQAALTQSFAGDVPSLTAGEGIAANDAVCLDLHNGTGANVFRVFRCDSDLPNRRRNFMGFATAAATVTPGIYTYTISAAFVASNVIATTINGRGYSTTYASSSDATLQAVATQIATDPDVQSAVVTVVGGNQTGTDDRVITVTSKGGLSLNMSAVVTAGASQPTVTVSNTQAASGQNVRIRNFGLISGFTSLTVGSNYYISGTAGAITTTPTDPAPIFVGQAFTSTQLFANTNPSNYQFTTPTIFVRSHGSSVGNARTNQQDSEHFNFTSWSAGASSALGGRSESNQGGSAGYNGYHHRIDGNNSSGTAQTEFEAYNKASWQTLTNHATSRYGTGAASFNGYLYIGSGILSGGAASGTVDKWNGASWSNAVAAIGAAGWRGVFTQGGSARFVAGRGAGATNQHDVLNSSDVYTTTTVAPTSDYTSASAQTGSSGFYINDGTTASYVWSGSWSSSITVPHTVASTNQFEGCAGYDSGSGLSVVNGGNSGASAIATSATFNGTSWTAATSSTNARSSCVGSVF